MGQYPLNQSSWGRAKQDTLSAQKTAGFMWYGEGVLAVAGGTWLVQIAPVGAPSLEIVMRSVIGGLGGLVTAILIIFAWNLYRAPYRQRNEARDAFENLSKTPLILECNSYEKRLSGKNWLGENLYLWLLNVILTNQSDKQNVSTKVISLEVHYPVAGGNVKSYALSLVPDTDREKYGHPSMGGDKSLGENEFLRPRESLRGFYQFLDGEGGWKPKSIQTWPTLVVMDSFGALHRREFKRPQFATQSMPDKEGSQT